MYNLAQHSGFTGNLLSFALAGLSGAATTHSHTASVPIVVAGVFGTSPSGTTTPTVNSSATDRGAVTSLAAAGSAFSVVAPSAGFRGALVVWTVDSSGTKRIRSRGWFESASGLPIDLVFPDIPTTEVPLSYHTLKAGTTVSGTWTFGSSNWNATGITVGTVVNLFGMPSGVVILS